VHFCYTLTPREENIISASSSGNEGGGLLEALQRPSRVRNPVGFRCDPYLWGLFRERCRNIGLSICVVLEALIRAWITGEEIKVPKGRPITVNMRVDYVVERHRRGPPERLIPLYERRCPECGSNRIYEKEPEDLPYLDGQCKECGAEWLIKRGDRE